VPFLTFARSSVFFSFFIVQLERAILVLRKLDRKKKSKYTGKVFRPRGTRTPVLPVTCQAPYPLSYREKIFFMIFTVDIGLYAPVLYIFIKSRRLLVTKFFFYMFQVRGVNCAVGELRIEYVKRAISGFQ